MEIGRTNSFGELTATATGTRLAGPGFSASLAREVIAGTFQTRQGEINFSVTRSD